MHRECVFFMFGTDLFSRWATTLSRCNGDKHSLRNVFLQVIDHKFFGKIEKLAESCNVLSVFTEAAPGSGSTRLVFFVVLVVLRQQNTGEPLPGFY